MLNKVLDWWAREFKPATVTGRTRTIDVPVANGFMKRYHEVERISLAREGLSWWARTSGYALYEEGEFVGNVGSYW